MTIHGNTILDSSHWKQSNELSPIDNVCNTKSFLKGSFSFFQRRWSWTSCLSISSQSPQSVSLWGETKVTWFLSFPTFTIKFQQQGLSEWWFGSQLYPNFHLFEVRLQRAPEGGEDHEQCEDRGCPAQHHLLLGERRQVKDQQPLVFHDLPISGQWWSAPTLAGPTVRRTWSSPSPRLLRSCASCSTRC